MPLKKADALESGKNGRQWCVYVLRCSNDSLYIGITNDLDKRIERHRVGTGSKFVRSWRPFELLKTIPCETAGEARRLEYDLKRLTRQKKIEALGLRMGRQNGNAHHAGGKPFSS